MKCKCGYERIQGSVLCRMLEGADGRFLVEICGADDRLTAQSAEGLDMKGALDYVETMVDRQRYSTHFHWEEGGSLIMAANARRVLENAATVGTRMFA
jgi:hypothetical protein